MVAQSIEFTVTAYLKYFINYDDDGKALWFARGILWRFKDLSIALLFCYLYYYKGIKAKGPSNDESAKNLLASESIKINQLQFQSGTHTTTKKETSWSQVVETSNSNISHLGANKQRVTIAAEERTDT
jgi:hypothetical protein